MPLGQERREGISVRGTGRAGSPGKDSLTLSAEGRPEGGACESTQGLRRRGWQVQITRTGEPRKERDLYRRSSQEPLEGSGRVLPFERDGPPLSQHPSLGVSYVP